MKPSEQIKAKAAETMRTLPPMPKGSRRMIMMLSALIDATLEHLDTLHTDE